MDEDSIQKYQVAFKGEIEAGQELKTVKERLVQLFKTSPEQIDKLFTGKPIILNHNLDHTAAQEYVTDLKNAGALCYFEPMKKSHPEFQAPGTGKVVKHPAIAKSAGFAQMRPPVSKVADTKKKAAKPSTSPQLYFTGCVIVATGMVFLFLAYIVLAFIVARATFDHIVDNTTLFDMQPLVLGILAYIVPAIIGILLFAAMCKSLFARPVLRRFSISLPRQKERSLYAFVDKVCRSIGSNVPSSIEVNCSEYAYASYKRGLMSFLEDDLSLIVGLPLASEMTLKEFTSVIAHEFGHYTENIEMRLYYIITSIKSWFNRVANEQDEIDQKFIVLTGTSSLLFRPFLSIAKLFIWLNRKIVALFLILGRRISRFHTDQMETAADRHAMQLAGSEVFDSSKRKLQSIAAALKEAYRQLKVQKRPSDNSLPDDFILLVSSIFREKADKTALKTKNKPEKEETENLETQSSESEITNQVNTTDEKETDQSDQPASTLFINFSELCKTATTRLYKEVLGLQFDQDSLVPTSEFLSSFGQDKGDMNIEPETEDNPFF